MSGPLEGVRVVDLSTTFMGPYCTLLLSQMGADVIKVEQPGGDVLRHIGTGRSPGMGPIFLTANAGKRSIVLDLKRAKAHDALMRLVANTDVFVHNLRRPAAERLGVDATTLLTANPQCIYCSFRGFDDGPYEGMPAYDDVIQALSGMATTQGGSGDPRYIATPVVDKTVGLAGAAAILAALYRRQSTGIGEEVVVPMMEFMVSYMLLDQQGQALFDPPLGPPGYARTSSPHRRPYATSDGYISVLVYTDRQWRRFFEIVNRTEVAQDPRFCTILARTEHIDELYQLLGDELRKKSTREWLSTFADAEIPAAPLRNIEDLFTDEHLVANGFFQTTHHRSEGALRTARFPLRFGHGTEPVAGAPTLGEHSRDVLLEAGVSSDEIDELVDSGALVATEESR